ncbi:ANM_collapsed_G0058600.mRNA.1.CDS.1 [Saccharomyces cerevisiae]|nr:ANM_collapsed_G0058600.mRNA.1.CDS.1 [Saccharomyces cerevisiae]
MEGMNMGSSMNMDAMSSASKTVASSMASMSMDAMSSASKTIASSMASMSMDAMSSASKTILSSMSSMSMEAMSSASKTLASTMSSMAMVRLFGIFLLFVVAAFVYKLLLFVSWCLEVHWFKKWDKQNKYSTLPSANSKDEGKHYDTENNFEIQGLPKLPNLLSDIFVPSLMDLFHDIIRAFLVFTSTMIIYMLMLATMSFVLTYVFAVITGLALSEVFFNRCKIAMLKRWDIQREIQKAKSCPGFGNCQCGRHPEPSPDPIAVADTTSGSDQSTRLEKNNESKVAISENNQKKTPTQEEECNCATDSGKNQANIERDILENSKLQEQSGNMDQNLLPAEKFTHN